jgi:hypothetical protein
VKKDTAGEQGISAPKYGVPTQAQQSGLRGEKEAQRNGDELFCLQRSERREVCADE